MVGSVKDDDDLHRRSRDIESEFLGFQPVTANCPGVHSVVSDSDKVIYAS